MGRHLYAHAVPALARLVVPVSSLSRAMPFYESVLRMTRLYTTDDQAILQGDGYEVMLQCCAPAPTDGSVVATFRVSDLDDAMVAAIAVGAKVIAGPDDQPWGERQVTLRDPDGHRVSLVVPMT